MLKSQVIVGECYIARVGPKLTVVHIIEECGRGYSAKNTISGRDVFIKSAAKLRRMIPANQVDMVRDIYRD